MEKVFISKNYRNPYTASSKAKIDVEEILKTMGFRNIGLPCHSYDSSLIGRAWTYLSYKLGNIRLPHNGCIFLQHPSYKVENIVKKAIKNNNSTIVIIHDINYLRNTGTTEELDYLTKVSYVIVHTPQMKEYIETNYPGPKVFVLGIFDYLHSKLSPYSHSNNYTIAFAGNLEKSYFLKQLIEIPIIFNLYGIGGDKIPKSSNVLYKGLFHPSKLGENIEADFGLVWDGNDIDKCSGNLGEYLKIIAPHKLSMYLSAGIPVIVWKKAAIATIVEKECIGFTIDSLEQIPQIIEKMPSEQYAKMKKKALQIAAKLNDGFYLRKAVSYCLEDCLLNKKLQS